MASGYPIKLSVFIFVVLSRQAGSATNYISDNTISPDDASRGHYSAVPQAYYVPYDKYVSNGNHKYVIPRPEAQIPVTVTSTEKTLLSPAYSLAVDTTKYATAKPPEGSQVSYPYLYTLAKVVPSTAATYTSASHAGNSYYEEPPKKYHYGYRVSNPHTGTEFGHSEVNDGLSAKGYYHVLLPDGRLQNVKYWAGPSGYHATITYETQY